MVFKRFIFIIGISFLFYSCLNSIDGNKKVVTESRNVSAFSKLDISGEFEIIINQTSTEKLELEVDENLISLIETEVKNGTLFISTKEKIGNSKSLKLYISMITINEINTSGAIEIKNKGKLKTEILVINASGAADIDLTVEVENLQMDLSGASETTLSGDATNFEIILSGASELEAEKLETQQTMIDISGAGKATVFVKNTLNVEVSGAGSVQYKGNPTITKNISGAGSINKL
jgi:hypothetical protein